MRMKWNKETIINTIKKLQNDGIKINYKSIYNTNKKLIYASDKYFGNWSCALEAAGIKADSIIQFEKWSKEKVIDRMKKLSAKGIKLITSSIYKEDKLLLAAIHSYFGSLRNAIVETGLKNELTNKYTITDAIDIATKNNGKCLSTELINTLSKIKFECANGHVWITSFANVLYSYCWCPYCTVWKTEEKCRYVFEWLTKLQFPKTRKILGGRKELDGYCKELNIAFEFNGKQHYEYVDYFYKNKKQYEERQKLDKEKREICKSMGIILIEIPYYVFNSGQEINFIMQKLVENSIIIRNTDFSSFSYPNFNKTKLDKMRKTNIKRKKYITYNIEDIKKIAETRNGKCLSKIYINQKTKLEFECELGHKWYGITGNVIRGSWCPQCGIETIRKQKIKYSIDKINEFIAPKGGKCISTEYKTNHHKLKFVCSSGHCWEARFHDIKDNHSWCPICFNISQKDKKKKVS